jgi:phage-related protein
MNNRMTQRSAPQHWLALFLLVMLFSLGATVNAQSTTQMGMPNTQADDGDTKRWQVANVDQFLDGHPEIAEQLRRDPSLINNDEFVRKHPALQEYLQQHPGVREEFTENPQAFMHREERYDRWEGERGDSDITRQEVANMDRFLDRHPEIAEQLRKDPSLIRNEEFVEKHPGLQEFLQQHPGVREEFTENPQAFMQREERYDEREGRDFDRDNDTTRRQIARMDNFLDNHPEIAEQLRKDPSLIRNQDFVAKHPALQEYLQQHPGIREEFTENPQAFMRREERYDRWEDRTNRIGDRNMARGEVMSFGQFLGNHSLIGQQLSHDPSLVNNKEYLESHGELHEYLNAHPGVREELTENPRAFMDAVQQSGSAAPGKTITPKPKGE